MQHVLRWVIPCLVVSSFTLQQFVQCPAPEETSVFPFGSSRSDDPSASEKHRASIGRGLTQSEAVAPWLAFEDGPGQYILREPEKWAELGASLSAERREKIKGLLANEVCKDRDKHCREELEVQRSLLGSTGSKGWYSATAPSSGAVFAKVDERKVALDSVQVPHSNYKQMDILVPLKSKERVEKMTWFSEGFGNAVAPFAKPGMKFRMLVSKYQDDAEDWTEEFLQEVQKNAKGIEVVLVPCEPKAANLTFNRASCVNCLLAQSCKGDDCAVALMDVDIYVSARFVSNSLAYTHPGKSIYFPVFFSEYNPEMIQIVEEARAQDRNLKRMQWAVEENYKGVWREDSTGMWVMAGTDAAKIKMDDSFDGWGGEDMAFHEQLIRQYNIIRSFDSGLFHKFHSKDCKLGSFVNEEQAPACISSWLKQEGTLLSIYLNHLKKS